VTAEKDQLKADLETAKAAAEKAATDAKAEVQAQLDSVTAEKDQLAAELETAKQEAAAAAKTVEEAAATAAEAAKAEVEEALKKALDFDNMNLETLQEIVEKLKAPLEKLGYTLQLEKKAAE